MVIGTQSLIAEVTVVFSNTTVAPGPMSPSQLGTTTLQFTVDGSGNVTLDASTSSANATTVAAVDAWDGAVGTVTSSSAFGSVFEVTLVGLGGSNLRITNVAGGSLGVGGLNAWRVDNDGAESIVLDPVTLPSGKIQINSMDWHNQANEDIIMKATTAAGSVTNDVITNSGNTESWDLSAAGFLLGQAESITFGNEVTGVQGDGYSIAAIRFDVVDVSSVSTPVGLSATTDGASVDLDWNDDTSGLLEYYSVYRSTTEGTGYTQIAEFVNDSNYSDTDVVSGTTYFYVVTATDDVESGFSDEVTITAVIQPPSNLVATPDEELVGLDWDDSNSPIFASFSVYRSETMGSGYTEIASGITDSFYFDSDLTNGTTYYYIVTATDNGTPSVESAFSSEAAATPFANVIGSELYVHLDATIANSVTIEPTDKVTEWADQSPNGLNASAAIGDVLYPSASRSSSGLSGLDMGPDRNTLLSFDPAGQDSWLDFTNGAGALPYTGFAVLVAIKADSILGGISREIVLANHGNAASPNSFILRYQAGVPALFLGGQPAGLGASSISAGDTVILAANYNAPTGDLEFWDSQSATSTVINVPAGDFSHSEPMFLGGSPNSDQKMNGMIGEVKIYRGVMTATDFANEQDALVTKWISSSGNTALEQWREDNFGSTANSGDGADDANPDADAAVNLLDFAFGLNPNLADALPVTWDGSTATRGIPSLRKNGSGFDFLFTRRIDFSMSGSVDYTVQFSSDLTDWEVYTASSPTVLTNLTDVDLVSVPLPATLENGKAPRFARLVISVVP